MVILHINILSNVRKSTVSYSCTVTYATTVAVKAMIRKINGGGATGKGYAILDVAMTYQCRHMETAQ